MTKPQKNGQSATGLLAAILIGAIVGYFGSNLAATAIYSGSLDGWEKALAAAEAYDKELERIGLMRMTPGEQAAYYRFAEAQARR